MSKATKKSTSRKAPRNTRSGQFVVKHVAGTIQLVSDRARPRGADVRSLKLEKLPTRPTSLSSLREISVSYGVALDRLAKR